MSNSNNSSSGVSLGGVIFLILLFLKLFGVIDISWWWVFSPVLISLGFLIIFLVILWKFTKK
jgi:Na+(H+)/acetate symporter ActP